MEPSSETNFSPEPINTSINPSSVSNKNNLWLLIVAVLLFAILGVGIFISWKMISNASRLSNINNKSNPTKNSDSSNQDNNATTQSPQSFQKKIAYVKENSLWVINADGLKKTELVSTKGITNFSIRDLAWKDKDSLSYIRCIVDCQIFTQNVESNTEVLQEVSPVNLQIFSLAWNHAGNKLAYIYKLSDGEMKLNFKSGSDDQVVKTFAVPNAGGGGRDATLDDNVSIYFSPDDKYVLVTNTLGQPNNIDQSTVWVFDSGGKELLNIKSDTNSWATQGRWWGIDSSSYSIIYKAGNELKSKFITGHEESLISIKNFYNPATSPTYAGVIYWINGSLPNISFLSNFGEGGKSAKNLIDGYFKPEFLYDFQLVAIKAVKVPPGQEVISPFISAGLSKIDLRDKQAEDLDSGDINLFAVSP